MIHGIGSSLWPRSNQSWKDHSKAIEASEDSGTAIEVLGASGEEMEASGDSDQEVATEVTDSETKARSGVSVKYLVSN